MAHPPTQRLFFADHVCCSRISEIATMAELNQQRPLGLRLMNGIGGALQRVGVPLVPLDEERLLTEATRRTGLSDFGDEWFRDPLRRLLDAYEREAALTTLGRLIARNDICGFWRTACGSLIRGSDTLKYCRRPLLSRSSSSACRAPVPPFSTASGASPGQCGAAYLESHAFVATARTSDVRQRSTYRAGRQTFLAHRSGVARLPGRPPKSEHNCRESVCR